MLSIIIPVYNAEKVLTKTLDSIANQTYTDWECILVNDGSSDGSFEICTQMANQDPRFHVYSKTNGGVSSARNIGLSVAEGEIIAFCDADDILEPEMYARLINALITNNVDIVSCRYVPEKNVSKIDNEDISFTVSERTVELFYEKEHHLRALWNKVYKKELLRGMEFNCDISYREDELFVLEAMLKAKRVAYTNAIYYHYMDCELSATKQHGSYTFWGGFVKAMKLMVDLLENYGINQKYIDIAKVDCGIAVISLLRLAIQERDRYSYTKYLQDYEKDLQYLLDSKCIRFDKKLSYWTYCKGYTLASLVHYYLKLGN